MKKAIVFLADGFEEIEAITVIDYLRRAGVVVQTVAVPGNKGKEYNSPEGSHKITVISDMNFTQFLEEYKTDLPDLIYIPGGIPGAPNNAACEEEIKFILRMFKEGKFVTALCASPAVVLAKTGVLQNKKWTCYPGMEQNLAEYCGSEQIVSEVMKGSVHIDTEPFVTDGNVVTGRGPGATEQFAMELVRLLTDEETALKIKKSSVQR